jgi:cob(I)alamin adenosyltransferase
MSIVTKTGDKGATALMYGRRVPKSHPRVEAYGCVDELNSALGLARASAEHQFVRDNLLRIQQDLVILMGELATAVEDLPRYEKDGYSLVSSQMIHKLDALVQEIESQKTSFKGWATPGANPASAALDVARTVCRRAERRVCALQEAGQLQNAEILIYLNRLADLLWLLARWVETKTSTLSASAAIPRSRERERVAEGRVRDVGEKHSSEERAG